MVDTGDIVMYRVRPRGFVPDIVGPYVEALHLDYMLPVSSLPLLLATAGPSSSPARSLYTFKAQQAFRCILTRSASPKLRLS